MKDYVIEKDFKVDGFRCVVVGQSRGFRCGYIEIPKDNILYEKEYDDVNELVDVHGGWTYSEYGNDEYPVVSSKDSWWIGFDCAHLHDAIDLELVKLFGEENTKYNYDRLDNIIPDRVVKTTEYVENELIDAVKQIEELKEEGDIK